MSYNITSLRQPSLPMQAVIKNIDLKGSTMGSRREFGEMVRFVSEKEIRPVVQRVVHGIENLEGIEGLFEDLKKGTQFGKLVVKIGSHVTHSIRMLDHPVLLRGHPACMVLKFSWPSRWRSCTATDLKYVELGYARSGNWDCSSPSKHVRL